MAAVVSAAYEHSVDGPIKKVTLSWLSHTDGTATFTTEELTGTLVGVTFNPGSTTPSANYDVTLKDTDEVDVLAGQGANLSETTSTRICPSQPMKDGTTTSTAPFPIHSTLALSITNAGSAKNGTIVLYLR
jgi:hypothetical protein